MRSGWWRNPSAPDSRRCAGTLPTAETSRAPKTPEEQGAFAVALLYSSAASVVVLDLRAVGWHHHKARSERSGLRLTCHGRDCAANSPALRVISTSRGQC